MSEHIPHAHSANLEDLVSGLGADVESGLSNPQVQSARSKFGPNSLPEPPTKTYFQIFFSQFLSPLIYLLLLAAVVAAFIGETKDALVIIVVVLLNAAIGSYQEGRAENSLKALRKMSGVRCRVRRQGQESVIEASELVPGDLILLTAGDAIPSDARLVFASSMMVTEAALTGESVPVAKQVGVLADDTPMVDRVNMVHAGTFLTMGRGIAVVTATGQGNEIGKIAKLTSETAQLKTPLEQKVQKFGQQLVFAAIGIFFLVLCIGWIRQVPWAEIFMVAISQTVSLVPEGLPVAITVALAVGVQRMARKKTIVRRLSAVESLGSVNTICSDKTGTLTRNEMVVKAVAYGVSATEIQVQGQGYDPTNGAMAPVADADFQDLVLTSVICNDADLSKANEGWRIVGDPTEAALLTLAMKSGADLSALRSQHPRVAEVPFDSDAKMMAAVIGSGTGRGCRVLVKGAPESIFQALSPSFPAEQKVRYQELAKNFADRALRVLAFAVVEDEAGAHANLSGFAELNGKMRLIGLVGQMDPPRSEVRGSVDECRAAGIRTVMVTGDHRATAVAIAKELDIHRDGDLVIDGAELDSQWPDERLREALPRVSVLSRVHPGQKQRIVRLLQEKGMVVAMTGDGVNDAPALAKADIGVAMGITGTEVAKEASKIVITDDRFSTIVEAIAEGRLVYRNIKKLILFLFVTSIDEVVILFLALVAGFGPPLLAIHVLWINLVTEGVLTINLIMDPPEGEEMKVRPVPLSEPLLDRALLSRIPLMVIASVASVFGWFLFRTYQGVSHDLVRTETFTALAVSQWWNVLNCRSTTHSVLSREIFSNHWLILGLIAANLLQLAVVYLPFMNEFFHTEPISLESFAMIGVVTSLVLWVEEARKWLARRREARSGAK